MFNYSCDYQLFSFYLMIFNFGVLVYSVGKRGFLEESPPVWHGDHKPFPYAGSMD